MVMCCQADTPLAEINAAAAAHGLRFPLVCDPTATLRAHLSAMEYASGSARFGPFVDNILGMNWELKSGTIVRVGERVIKSTTGYDLLRFLLHSDGRYGKPLDYVIRLRPIGGEIARAVLHGDDTIERACAIVQRSPWVHWLDSVDVHLSGGNGAVLEISADCSQGETACYSEFFAQLGRESGARLQATGALCRPVLPALALKSTRAGAREIGGELVREFGGDARVLAVNGVVHYYPPSPAHALPAATLNSLAKRCSEQGGHLFGAMAPPVAPNATEAGWAKQLETAWNLL